MTPQLHAGNNCASMLDMHQVDTAYFQTLDFKTLLLLAKLLETASVTRTAEAMSMSQPAASRSVERLRKAVGDPLLVRARKGYALTTRAEELRPLLEQALSGITRLSSGFPITISSDQDRSLQGSSPNGVNNHSLDLPDYTPSPLDLNHNPRNGLPYFDTALFSPNTLGTPGSASRRSFYGPGIFNFDIALLRNFRLSESKALQFRVETFNTFNHTQFFGPAAVNGDSDSDLFGRIVRAAPPRLMQIALKFTF